MRKLFPIFLSFFILASCQDEKATLSLNLEEGETYKQKSSIQSTINQEIDGQKINMIMGIDGVMAYKVTKANASDYEMDVTYESLSISMNLPQGKMEFSSDKEGEADIFSKILSEMTNTPFQLKMSKLGKVLEIKNIDKLFESAFNKFPDLPADQMAQIKSQLSKAYGEKSFRGNIEMATAIYPVTPVNEGDSWEIKTTLESGLTADMNSTYTLSEENSKDYLIIGDTDIETTDKQANVELNGMSMRYDMKGKMASRITVDKETGWILEAKVSQNIGGDVYMQPNAQMPDGMKIPMTMTNEMIFSN